MQSEAERNRYKTVQTMVPEYYRLPGEIYILGKTWQLKTRAPADGRRHIETYEARVCGEVGILLHYPRTILQIKRILKNLFETSDTPFGHPRYKIILEDDNYILTIKH